MKKNAITLIEIIVSVTILSVILVMLTGMITKKAHKAADISAGTFTCFKNSKGILIQKVTLQDGTIQEKRAIEQCKFTFPSGVKKYKVYVIGAGGGGGTINNDFEFWKESARQTETFKLFSQKTKDCSIVNNFASYESSSFGVSKYANSCPSRYNCTSGVKKATPTNTMVNNLFENEALEKTALQNRSMYVEGGSNGSILGAKCAFRANLKLNQNFTYFNGYNEIYCPEAASSPNISASPGVFSFGGSSTIAQGATFSDASIIVPKDTVSTKPTCKMQGVSGEVVSLSTIDETDSLSFALVSPSVQYGDGGKAGTTIENSNLNLAGKTITITKEEIGNPGLAGQNGQDTSFKSFNITAWGGEKGATHEEKLSTNITSTGVKIKLTDVIQASDKLTLSQGRMQYHTKTNANANGKLSNYVNNVALIGVANQTTYKGIGSVCTKEANCTQAQEPNEESFGAGGGGGNSMVKYDPISYIAYKRPNFANNTIETSLESTKTPEVVKSQASSGMGGAIVIKW